MEQYINKDLKTINFIKESIKIHGENEFDYKDTIYKDTRTKIIMNCKKGHLMEVLYKSHITAKRKCKKCADINNALLRIKKAEETFAEKSIKIHGEKYNYNEVKYVNCKTPVLIICDKNHKFEITPFQHLNGKGCTFCNNINNEFDLESTNVKTNKKKFRWTKDLFLQKAKEVHGEKFDYSLVNFNICLDSILIICEEEHVFKTRIHTHLKGGGCNICSFNEHIENITNTNEDFIKKSKSIFGEDMFDYSLVNYINIKTKVILKCKKKNHVFEIVPYKHYSRLGCPHCVNKSESLLFDYLKVVNPNFIHQYFFKDIDIIKKKPFDFCFPEQKIIIELDGEQHFKFVPRFKQSVEERQRNDFIKMLYAFKLGYTIIRIYQPDIIRKKIDWIDILKENIFVYNEPEIIYLAKEDSSYENYRNNFELFLLNLTNINDINKFINNEDDIEEIDNIEEIQDIEKIETSKNIDFEFENDGFKYLEKKYEMFDLQEDEISEIDPMDFFVDE